MGLNLIVKSGKSAGRKIPVTKEKFFIGRAEDCHLRPGSDLVSRHHCVLLTEEGYIGVRDFGSKNGTYVNDEPVVGQTELKNGDVLRVGELAFDVELEVRVGGKKKPKVRSVQEAATRTAQSSRLEDEDIDLASWLSEEDTTDLSDVVDSVRETTDPANTPTEVSSKTDTGKSGVPKKKDGASRAEDSAGTSSKKQPEAATSGDAAADVLKNLFKRR